MTVLRLHPRGLAPDENLIARCRHIPAAAMSDALEKMAAMVGIAPVGNCLSAIPGGILAGRAFTVRTRPGDNLALHKALDEAGPGDVVVVDARGDLSCSIMGDLMTRYAQARSVTAVVVDGAVRDRATISAGTMPIFSRGFSHIGPTKDGPGELHGPVCAGGQPVHDGDVIIGDEDGLTVVPLSRLAEAVTTAEKIVAGEEDTRAAIDTGRWDRSWIDRAAAVLQVDRAAP